MKTALQIVKNGDTEDRKGKEKWALRTAEINTITKDREA